MMETAMRSPGSNKRKRETKVSAVDKNVKRIDISNSSLFEHIGRRIWDLRKDAGMTQGELAAQLSLSRVAVATMEAGKQSISFQTLLALAQIFGTPICDMVPEELVKLLAGPILRADGFSPEEISNLRARGLALPLEQPAQAH